MDLTPEEVRVVGCLLEKERTTPDVYPLTLNSLVNACNQTSNREPVVAYDPATVEGALRSLRERGWTRVVHSVHNRAAKYRHVVDEVLGLEPQDAAVVCVLLLRGPQTVGELRTRTERLADFDGLDEIEATLDRLAGREEPVVVRLARRPGQKEARWAHLLGGPVEVDAEDDDGRGAAPAASPGGRAVADRLAALEAEVASLRESVAELRRELGLDGSD